MVVWEAVSASLQRRLLSAGGSATVVEPDLVALHASRGYEDESSKLFMRNTVLVLWLSTAN